MAASAPPAIAIKDLVKSFGDVKAVDGIDFEVPSGSTVALLGGNGAGKTTTIAMLLGLIVPTSGTISILGFDMATNRHAVLPRMNFESPYVDLPKRLTVAENLLIYGRLYGLDRVRDRVHAIAASLNLTEFLDRPAGQLSAGQKTRVGLAKALINEPEVLLLDEPTASLDPDTADWIRTHFEDYQKRFGASILLASHNMAEVERLADNVLMMVRGKIIDRGSPADLIRRYGRSNLDEVFIDMARSRTGTAVSDEEAMERLAASSGDKAND